MKAEDDKTRPAGKISDDKGGHHSGTVLKHSFFLFYNYIIALEGVIVKV